MAVETDGALDEAWEGRTSLGESPREGETEGQARGMARGHQSGKAGRGGASAWWQEEERKTCGEEWVVLPEMGVLLPPRIRVG